MRILVAGSHGQIGQRLVHRLHARGHEVVAMIRSADQADELRDLGAEPVVADVEGDLGEQLGEVLTDLDAIVYTVGAGPGSGPEPKDAVDRAGSDKLVDLAERHGIERYVLVSTIGAHDPSQASGDFRAYLEAKRAADDRLRASDLTWTIVRPGRLTDDPGTGQVTVRHEPGGSGSVPRDDVAAVLVEVVERDDLGGAVFELFEGDTPIAAALATG